MYKYKYMKDKNIILEFPLVIFLNKIVLVRRLILFLNNYTYYNGD